jgi:hypothetical protein
VSVRSLCPVKSRRRARSSSTSPHRPGNARLRAYVRSCDRGL